MADSMKLDEFLRQRLAGNATISTLLATYSGAPAVFAGHAPEDGDSGWEGGKVTPRVILLPDLQEDNQRGTQGTIHVRIECGAEGTAPEELAPLIRDCLTGAVFCSDEYRACSLTLRGGTEKPDGGALRVVSVPYDVFSYPLFETADPDPVLALNLFVRHWAPDAVVLGQDEISDVFEPTAEHPAFWFRLAEFRTQRETNAVVWMDGVIECRILAPDSAGRFRWARALADELSRRGDVTMLDQAPLFLVAVQAKEPSGDAPGGLLRLEVRYGLLRKPQPVHSLDHANFSEQEVD